MTTTYKYSRGLTDNRFFINNKDRLDGELEKIFLSQEIQIAFPLQKFKTFGENDIYKVEFEKELTIEEKSELDGVIAAHKSNDDLEKAREKIKELKISLKKEL